MTVVTLVIYNLASQLFRMTQADQCACYVILFYHEAVMPSRPKDRLKRKHPNSDFNKLRNVKTICNSISVYQDEHG